MHAFTAAGSASSRPRTDPDWRYGAAGNLPDLWSVRQAAVAPLHPDDWEDGWYFPAPVGTYRKNPYGLHDVIGNVSEWGGDGFVRLDEVGGVDPFGPLALPERPVRGCAWSSFASNCRLGFRDAAAPDTRAANLGFRVVRAAE